MLFESKSESKKKKKKKTKLTKKQRKKLKRKTKFINRRKKLIKSFTPLYREIFDNMSKEDQDAVIDSILLMSEIPSEDEFKKQVKDYNKRMKRIDKIKHQQMKDNKVDSIKKVGKYLKEERKYVEKINKRLNKQKKVAKLFDPRTYDRMKLDVDDYKHELRKLAKKEQKDLKRYGLDCTMNGYKKALENNDPHLSSEFFIKHGF